MPEKNANKRKAASSASSSPAKIAKHEPLESDSVQTSIDNVTEFYAEKRSKALPTSGGEFKFNKKRVRMITKVKELPVSCKGIVYWMFRDQRVEGTLLHAFISRYLGKELPNATIAIVM